MARPGRRHGQEPQPREVTVHLAPPVVANGTTKQGEQQPPAASAGGDRRGE